MAAKKVLDELRAQFDYVVVDSSPLLAVTDAAILAAGADGVLIMARFGETKREQLAHAVGSLEDVGAQVLGAVFTMMPARGSTSYSYYGSYGTQQPTHASTEAAALNPPPSRSEIVAEPAAKGRRLRSLNSRGFCQRSAVCTAPCTRFSEGCRRPGVRDSRGSLGTQGHGQSGFDWLTARKDATGKKRLDRALEGLHWNAGPRDRRTGRGQSLHRLWCRVRANGWSRVVASRRSEVHGVDYNNIAKPREIARAVRAADFGRVEVSCRHSQIDPGVVRSTRHAETLGKEARPTISAWLQIRRTRGRHRFALTPTEL